MSALSSTLVVTAEPPTPLAQVLAARIWAAPLVPVALAATAGIVADRWYRIPLPVSLAALCLFLAGWLLSRGGLALTYLLAGVAALGAAYHHWHRDIYPANDIGQFATEELRPARLRGVLLEEPVRFRRASSPLRTLPGTEPSFAVLGVTAYGMDTDWLSASGKARLIVAAPLEGLHVGDEVEVAGRLTTPASPANPGERDEAALLRDQRIRAVLIVARTRDAVTVRTPGGQGSIIGWLMALRGWGQRRLAANLPPATSGLAMALLLGEGSTLTGADWEQYKRTGVVHLLVVSGQQLVVLALFVGWVLRLAGLRRRRVALVLAVLLLAYALLTGGRPPVMRAAVTVGAAGLGLILGRVTLPANTFALAWLVVAALNPADLFSTGCKLSFLAVAILYWGPGRWLHRVPGPLERLIDESRPPWLRLLRRAGHIALMSYVVGLVIWLAAAPLVAAQYHIVTPIGALIGPPLLLLVSIAMIAGFLLLVVPVLTPVFAWVTDLSLAASHHIVQVADGLPGAVWYVGEVPAWWLWGFYLGVLGVLTVERLRRRWELVVPAALAWLCVGLIAGTPSRPTEELRCTFLAVGHGGCTLLELPDGRTLLYDAGAMAGPEVATRHILPYLAHRGIRRLDEVFVSHADIDHFNGLPAILERIAVGQVSVTPSFDERDTDAGRAVRAALARQRVPVRVVQAGDRLTYGALRVDVLHPPPSGPEGKENYRSLVLHLTHGAHRLLLTGDLEGPGLDALLDQPALPVDVLMAPHHGSPAANTGPLAAWCQPRVVVSCEGPPRGPVRRPEPYTAAGAVFLSTWAQGAVTVRSGAAGLQVQTFRTRAEWIFASPGAR